MLDRDHGAAGVARAEDGAVELDGRARTAAQVRPRRNRVRAWRDVHEAKVGGAVGAGAVGGDVAGFVAGFVGEASEWPDGAGELGVGGGGGEEDEERRMRVSSEGMDDSILAGEE